MCEMQAQTWTVILTGIYDFLTFLLLYFVFFEAIIKPKIPNIAFYMQQSPIDTQNWSFEARLADFILENKGVEIKNITIKSDPDEIGWFYVHDNSNKHGGKPLKTSEYFANKKISYLEKNQKLSFFWCDLEKNKVNVNKPFEIIIEYDNPTPIWKFFKKRLSNKYPFNFKAFEGIVLGATNKYDIHNVAEELTRIRKFIEQKTNSMEFNKTVAKTLENSQEK